MTNRTYPGFSYDGALYGDLRQPVRAEETLVSFSGVLEPGETKNFIHTCEWPFKGERLITEVMSAHLRILELVVGREIVLLPKNDKGLRGLPATVFSRFPMEDCPLHCGQTHCVKEAVRMWEKATRLHMPSAQIGQIVRIMVENPTSERQHLEATIYGIRVS
jgi:hypothetical protein